ncbi:hypothetical protein LPMP_090400 [Leishmania panamensis]|uniref:Uncharacterized protein n=1 Tax=Leishmania panamensis TaxID=5679 RepID=A0A088S392_LEIPA|nr:hypothetical protein LPMP_090400 [Leishmania panamensis]AIN95956.1 hypothetical protein LPMP_090400 [Leishmania panamensis]
MPATYALAKECQLLRGDVEGVLSLAAQLLLQTTTTASPPNGSAIASASSSTPTTSFIGPVVGAILTDVHVRSLLLNTLVRVLVPARRQRALLDDNKYVHAANMAALQEQQQQQRSNGPRPTNSVDGGSDVLQRYRVGRVVGVVPKPQPKAAKVAHDGSGSASCADFAAAAAEEGQQWLLAVYVGECVEPFAVSAIAEDVLTEVEHRIFVQSALSTNREEGSRRASVLPSQQPALLSAEMAVVVQQSIKDIRLALQLMQTADKKAAAVGVEAATRRLMQRASGVKRWHDASDNDADSRTHKRGTEAASAGESSNGLGTHFGNGASSQAARVARLTEDVTARGTQLQQLRQLLQQKEQEVKATLQQQQQQEARHRGEIDVWRAKVEEQSRTHERVSKESRESLEQRDRLLDEANTKLRRLAGMATKYKQVVDTVAALLKRSSGEGGDGTVMTPDDILIALQTRKSL